MNEEEEIGILEEKGERKENVEVELKLPDKVKEGTFAIIPYWHWNDVKEDKLPFGVVRIEKYDERLQLEGMVTQIRIPSLAFKDQDGLIRAQLEAKQIIIKKNSQRQHIKEIMYLTQTLLEHPKSLLR